MSMIIDGTNGATFNDGSLQAAASSPYVLKNRIINGAMMIDQRNAGASVTPTTSNTYCVDRWSNYISQSSKYSIQQNAGSVTPPAGFTKYLGVTSASAYSVLATDYFLLVQNIEGFNVADLGWGTANAKTVTLSFWVYSSLTGTFGGSLKGTSGTIYSYPFTYSIPVANTWTQISVTIAGSTAGTWTTDNTTGIQVVFGLGAGSSYSGTAGAWVNNGNAYTATGATSVVGTNGATWYVTGVQLEIGSTATPFERRLYGQELALCQRYYYNHVTGGGGYPVGMGSIYTASIMLGYVQFPVTMRTTPTISATSGTDYWTIYRNGGSDQFNSLVLDCAYTSGYSFKNTTEIASTAGQAGVVQTYNSSSSLNFSAEL